MDKSGILSWKFRIATASDMGKLGHAFARAAQLDKRPADLPHDILHIGLKAPQGAGKSVFADGFFSAMTRRVVESYRLRGRVQSLSETREAGWIRHYDTMVGSSLPARRDHRMEEEGKPGTDLAEHPEWDFWPYDPDQTKDKNDRVKSDYLICFRQVFHDSARIVTVWCRAEASQTEGFQDFLREAAPLMTEGPLERGRKNRVADFYLR